MSRPAKVALYAGGGILALLLLIAVAAVLILPSRWFEEKVRARLVYEVERASGGRAEIGSFHFDWKQMKARVAPFVLRGTEPASEAPLFRAEAIEVGLKIISIVKRDIDIASLHVEKPQVNLIVDQDGITNFPKPKVQQKSEKDPIEQVLDLAVQKFTIAGGSIRYADRKIPLELQGENFDANLAYDFSGPRYTGTLKFERLRLDSAEINPLVAAFESELKLERNRLAIDSARLAMARSNIAISGEVTDFKDPHAALKVNAVGDVSELGPVLKLPPPHTGTVRFAGNATYSSGESYRLAGKLSGQNLAVAQGGMQLRNVSVDSDVQVTSEELLLRGLVVKALDGSFTGAASLTENFKNLKLNGTVNNISVRSLAAAQGVRNLAWNSRISGPIEVTTSLAKGASDLRAGAKLNLSPVAGQPPLEGKIDVGYDQRTQSLRLGNSYLTTPASRLAFSGTLGQKLQVRIETRDLNDLLPVIAMASKNAPKELPVRLNPGGAAVFEGTVTGPTRTAEIAGALRVNNAVVRDQPIDSLVANIQANPSGVHLTSVAAGNGEMKLEGNFDVALRNWRMVEGAPLGGKVRLQGASIAKLLAANGQKLPIEGTLSVEMDVSGTGTDPKATLRLLISDPVIYGERFDRIRAEVNYTGGGVEVINGRAEVGSARMYLSGAYTHPPGDLKNGQLRFDVRTEGFTLAQFKHVRDARPGASGQIAVNAVGQADVRNGSILLTTLSGQVGLRSLAIDKSPIGDLLINAKTVGRDLTFSASGNLRGSTIEGNGTFQLAGDYPGRGELSFSPMTIATIQDLVRTGRGGAQERIPVDGVVEGRLTFAGPVRKPEQMTARLELPTIQLVPVRRATRPGSDRDLTFRNEGPVVVELDPAGVHVRNAHFVGPETDLVVAGTVNLKAKTPWDLRVKGNLNLALLEDFNADIVSSGATTIEASVRGTLESPQVGGRMELKNASFYMVDFPNGLDEANGTIVFDRNRATIERLTATTGGGKVALSGFLGYGAGELSYRLQARADGVRVRYPEGVSFTANAALNLNGTTSRGLLSGVVTVLRAGFNPRTDVGGLLAASAKPVQTPTTPNQTLRNLQLDVRVETIPNLAFQTNLTQDLQAEADLRIRGSAARPAVLGRISISQGEIQFFGNKYTINRGEIGFYNPARIEPVLDMDLETRVRGITVNINFSGPINKLNFSYRSDPPLQSTEIIALLAVGRDPTATSGLAASQTQTDRNMMLAGSNLLGDALAAPVSSRLQRFFGVSKLKIDPTLTNLDATPTARLTLEQQISRDITLTYIQDLSNTNQQIVRIQWDLNRNWSVVAVREENGLFGIDFLFKKRFK